MSAPFGQLRDEVGPEREEQRVRADAVRVSRLDRRARAPLSEAHHQGLEAAAPLGQLVDRPSVGSAPPALDDDLPLLEVPEAAGEHVRRRVWKARAEVGEPLRAQDQLADDQQRPAVPDQVEGVGDPAGVSVGAGGLGHGMQSTSRSG